MKEFEKELITHIAHDLKNHLGIIETYTEILRTSSNFSPDDTQFLEQISIANTQARILVNNLTNVSKIIKGAVLYDVQPFRLGVALEQTFRMLMPVASIREITIGTQCEEDLLVRSDQEKVIEALVNIMVYSIRSAPRGGRIHISATSSGDRARVDISDFGKEVAGGEFEKLVLKKSLIEWENLALYIAGTFLSALGEKLSVHKEGEGARHFSFSLPLSQSE